MQSRDGPSSYTTGEVLARVKRCIAELEALVKQYSSDQASSGQSSS